MDKNKKYQGHTNWATWNMSLWLNNEEWSYHFMRRCYDATSAERLALECYPNGTPDMDPGDLADVDWDSIADDFNDCTDCAKAEAAGDGNFCGDCGTDINDPRSS